MREPVVCASSAEPSFLLFFFFLLFFLSLSFLERLLFLDSLRSLRRLDSFLRSLLLCFLLRRRSSLLLLLSLEESLSEELSDELLLLSEDADLDRDRRREDCFFRLSLSLSRDRLRLREGLLRLRGERLREVRLLDFFASLRDERSRLRLRLRLLRRDSAADADAAVAAAGVATSIAAAVEEAGSELIGGGSAHGAKQHSEGRVRQDRSTADLLCDLRHRFSLVAFAPTHSHASIASARVVRHSCCGCEAGWPTVCLRSRVRLSAGPALASWSA